GGSPASPEDSEDQARAAVLKAPLSAWLPSYQITEDGKTTNHTVDCRQISHPDDYTGLSMLSVYSVDLTRHLGDIAPISLAADGDTVYGTTQSLYVASNPRWYAIPMAASGALPQQANPPATAGTAGTTGPATPVPPSKTVPTVPSKTVP